MRKMSEQDLKTMSSDDLREQVKILETQVSGLRKSHKETQTTEMEICYVQREIELRKKFGHVQQPSPARQG